ncbi:hypothetical protein Sjap_001786 [Stephania japonica]|uniref:Uncharacterized protein n=1 Tax=Stephania japonica TaxID=461633 RepID=A0AAP0KKS5_9MAGN
MQNKNKIQQANKQTNKQTNPFVVVQLISSVILWNSVIVGDPSVEEEDVKSEEHPLKVPKPHRAAPSRVLLHLQILASRESRPLEPSLFIITAMNQRPL